VTRSHPFLCSHPATNRPSPDAPRPPRALLAALALLLPLAASAALWNVRPAPEAKAYPWAVVSSAAGDELAVYRGKDNQVHLRFSIAGTFNRLAPSHCPTFQFDGASPLYHLPLDQTCHVDKKHALIDLGAVRNRVLVSAAVDQLMNGTQIEFRYQSADGGYHEADFPLKGSSAAIRRALGRDVRVRAK
jgi:hypothetical protein